MEGPVGPGRRVLPTERQGINHKFTISDPTGKVSGYVTINFFDDGSIGELFLRGIAKEGSTTDGFVQWGAWTTSVAIQSGTDLGALCRKMAYMKFQPSGPTDFADIPYAHSIPAYIGELLALKSGDRDLIEAVQEIRKELHN